MAELTPQQIDGSSNTYAAVDSGGDQFLSQGHDFVHVKNASGFAVVVRIVATIACNQGTLHDLVITVPDTEDRMIGPFAERFKTSANEIQVGYTLTDVSQTLDDVTIAALYVL